MAVTARAAAAHQLRAAFGAPGLLALAVVATQIAYPHAAPGPARARLTVVIVVLFFAASVTHAARSRGVRYAGVLVAVTGVGGLFVEALGVATGAPFGAYAYADTLGVALLGVPLVVPLAWTMMGYPAVVVGRRISRHRWGGAIAGAAALASWDLFLDPQMVAAGHWSWAPTAGPALAGVPVANFAGWFVVALLMMALLLPITPAADDRLPLALYVWTYGSSVLAHAVFLGLPASAVAGGVGMGIVVALLARSLRRAA